MSGAPLLLVHPGDHGVAVYARDLATAVIEQSDEIRTIDPSALARLPEGTAVHAHFTDRLWGDSPEEASRTFEGLARRLRVSVTLHDLPQESDGERNRPRRREAYALVAAAATGVVVNSAHERALLREEGVWTGAATAIPLPVELQADAVEPASDGSLGVLGYFYPGKGHDEAARAAATAGMTRMTVLGRASDGHAADLDAFVRRAADLGVEVEVTGWLDDREIARRGRAVAVPVIAHRHVSASGSLASWIGWGRRPIAVRNRYIDEMAMLRPGTLSTVDETGLAEAVRRAVGLPRTTWHGLARLALSRADVADAYLRFWAPGRR
ncbi:hypothetical protein DXT68_01645 [Microbacterium foliorum]|uniref:D-inositol 3-phosphate glycosyltransferase n=1 Tax=Microbacterium foliorum TaxID=104336 RepID=A0A0F0KIJ7_9MICO|nr:hypothetical protein [Microbacterium foliorum]AXL10983.1 hypothetical protein DXT68_01645 [Microbacterium foliorum]KJL20254.1 hypothetical protein RN50_02099 [Microbacterium foliorum]